MSYTSITKIIKPALNPAMKNTVALRQTASGAKNIFGNTNPSAQNVINKGHMNYLKSLREPNFKGAFESKLAEIIERLIPHDLKSRVDNMGTSKVALEMVRKDTGTDYGRIDELSLVKAAAILGTKLALHRREFKDIRNGLEGLNDL